MTKPGSSWKRRAVWVGGLAALLVAVLVLWKGKALPTSQRKSETREDGETAGSELATYAIGYGFALLLTLAAFSVVYWRLTSYPVSLGVVFGLALVQMIVHFRCFLHISFSEAARDDLQLILFSTCILLLMVGGTLVLLFNLRMRMM